jgi:homoserine/homoserine lactone efflux protein
VALTTWLALAAATLIISMTPGAGAINTMSNSLLAGWARSIWGILGLQVALLIHIAIVAAGVGVLVVAHPIVFDTVRYLGAGYLVFLGIRQALRAPRSAGTRQEVRPATDNTMRPWPMFRRGLFVNLTNPKAIVFFLAFVPPFIRPTMALLPQYAVLIATIVVTDICVMWFFFAGLARALRRLTASERGRRAINRTFGALFILVGALLALMR